MSATKRRATPSTAKRSTKRTSKGTASTSWLYPRRRRSQPGLPTTIGTALGTLVVTTLLDASWPVRIGLVALALVIGLAWVVFNHRREIANAASADDPADPTADAPAAQPPAAQPPTDPAG